VAEEAQSRFLQRLYSDAGDAGDAGIAGESWRKKGASQYGPASAGSPLDKMAHLPKDCWPGKFTSPLTACENERALRQVVKFPG
jgi:hypothetical protein